MRPRDTLNVGTLTTARHAVVTYYYDRAERSHTHHSESDNQ